MNNYDIFAKFYDSVMGDRIMEEVAIEKIIKKHSPLTKSILELGCGTGMFLKYFFDRGYEIMGIDLSEKMLEVASQRIPVVYLSHQDMTAFSLAKKYDVILCLFDSINHVLTFDGWEKLFFRTQYHLNKGGIFIFDINTNKKLKALSQFGSISRKFNGNEVIMDVGLKNDIYHWNVRIIEKQESGGGLIHEEEIKEKSFPIKKVEESLQKIFNKVIMLDQSDGINASEESNRVYFICFK